MSEFTYSGMIAYDTIALGGVYSLSADGAAGGNAVGYHGGGGGAAVGGDIYLAAGTVLEIIVGGAGGAENAAGGGGGGSFIYDETTSTLLEAAGGGGGGGAYGVRGGAGQAGTAGGAGAGTGAGGGGSLGAGGGGGYFKTFGETFGAGGGGGYSGAGGRGGVASNTVVLGGGGGGAGFSTSGNMPGGAGNKEFGGPDSGGYGGGGGGDQTGGGGGGYAGGGGGGFLSGGGGGGSYVGDLTDVLATSGAHGGNGEVIIAEVLCYLHGTRILTPTGAVLVEELVIGDAVVTRFGAVQRIKWLGRQRFAPAFLANNAEKWPVCIAAGALAEGVPARDLCVSPGHSMLLGDVLVLASTLVNGVTITQVRPETQVDYVQIELAAHDCVLAEGAWSETYADAPGLRAQFHNAMEFYALYPDEAPVEALQLCAERPEQGAKLAAALRTVAERAQVTPGPLEGWVESASDWKIEGWVRDLSHPELPVTLEILVDGHVIGTTLACEIREDLRRAGKGRSAFRFTPPFRLRAEHLATLSLRRAADGVELSGGAQIRAQAAA